MTKNKPKLNKESMKKKIFREIINQEANRRFIFRIEREPRFCSYRVSMRFSSDNPKQKYLQQQTFLSEIDLMQQNATIDRIWELTIRDMVNNCFNKVFEDITLVHELERSFWRRLKYLFKK
jgi:hypothetical protein